MIGKKTHIFEVEGKNLFECIMQADLLAFRDVYRCGCCNGEDLYLRAYKAKEKFDYVKIVCANPECKATLTFGKTMDDTNKFFLRRNDDKSLAWEKYTPMN